MNFMENLDSEKDDEDERFMSPGNFSSCDENPSPYRGFGRVQPDEELEGDEETVFDRSVLLRSSKTKSSRSAGIDPTCKILGTGHLSGVKSSPMGSQHGALRAFVTVLLYSSFFALGMGIAILGPTLLDLAQHVDLAIDQISSLFPARSVGYLVGSVLGGCLVDAVNPACAMALPLFLCAVGTAIIPWMTYPVALGAAISAKGLGAGMLDTAGNVVCLNLWPDSPPAMQALHFFFGLGAFSAPLIAEPFLSSANTTGSSNESLLLHKYQNLHAVPYRNLNATTLRDVGLPTMQPSKPSTPPLSANLNASSVNSTAPRSAEEILEAFLLAASDFSSINTPYLIVGGSCLLLSFCFFFVCCFRARALRMLASSGKYAEDEREAGDAGMALLDGDPSASSGSIAKQNKNKLTREQKSKEHRTFKIRVLTLLFFLFALYVGMEVTYGGFILTYAVKGPPKLNKDEAAYLTSVFWGSFSVGRLLAIPMAKLLTPGMQMVADIALTGISAMGLVISGRKIPSILWVCSATLGLGMASIFPTGINWTEQYFLLTGKSTAVLVVAAAAGEMVIPVVTGQLFHYEGPISLMYIVLAVSIATLVIFLLLLRLAIGKPMIKRSVSEQSGFLSDMDTLDLDDADFRSQQQQQSPKLFRLGNSATTTPEPSKKRVTFKLNDSSKDYVKLDD